MNPIIYLLIGIAIGWLLELLIDYFFWRNKSICTESVASLRHSETENARLNAELLVLNGQLDNRRNEITDLRARITTLQNSSPAGDENNILLINQQNSRLEEELKDVRSRLYDCLAVRQTDNGQSQAGIQQTLAAFTAALGQHNHGDVSVQVGRESGQFSCSCKHVCDCKEKTPPSPPLNDPPNREIPVDPFDLITPGTIPIDESDLTLIYEIGDKTAEKFRDRGITSLKTVCKRIQNDEDSIWEIIREDAPKLHRFLSVPANTAAERKMAWKKHVCALASGKKGNIDEAWGQFETHFGKKKGDNFEAFCGINKPAEKSLYDIGINSFEALANASVDQLRVALQERYNRLTRYKKLKGHPTLETFEVWAASLKEQAEIRTHSPWQKKLRLHQLEHCFELEGFEKICGMNRNIIKELATANIQTFAQLQDLDSASKTALSQTLLKYKDDLFTHFGRGLKSHEKTATSENKKLTLIANHLVEQARLAQKADWEAFYQNESEMCGELTMRTSFSAQFSRWQLPIPAGFTGAQQEYDKLLEGYRTQFTRETAGWKFAQREAWLSERGFEKTAADSQTRGAQ